MSCAASCSCPAPECVAPCTPCFASPITLTFFPFTPIWLLAGGSSDEGERGFRLTATAELFLKGAKAVQPTAGFAGWISRNLGVFRTQVEPLGYGAFAGRLVKVLAASHFHNVLSIDVDYAAVYSDKRDKRTHDLGKAMAKLQRYLRNVRHQVNKVNVAALSDREGLHIALEVQYVRKHGLGKPSIELRIVGMPSEMIRSPRESSAAYRRRVKKIHVGEMRKKQRRVLRATMGELSSCFRAEFPICSEHHRMGNYRDFEDEEDQAETRAR